MAALKYRFSVLCRFLIAFGMGYLCCYFLALDLTLFFHQFWPKAESIYLAALIALIFFICFVIFTFCAQRLKLFSTISIAVLLGLFSISKSIG